MQGTMIHSRPTYTLIDYYCFQYCLRKPLTILILTLICCLLLFHLYHLESSTYKHISRLTRNTSDFDYGQIRRRKQRNHPEDKRIDDLLLRIEDLKRIKLSVNNELILIEREKTKLLKERASLTAKNDKLITQISRSKAQLKQLELDISADRRQKYEQTCVNNQVSPIILNPLKITDIEQVSAPENFPFKSNSKNSELGKVYHEFDLSLCSLAKEFRFHVNTPDENNLLTSLVDESRFKIDPIIARSILQDHRQHTSNSSNACLIINLLEGNSDIELNSERNNLVIDLLNRDSNTPITGSVTQKAVVASSFFHNTSFRNSVDLILPSIWQPPNNFETIVNSIPPQSPIDRKYLASYFGPGTTTNPAHSDFTNSYPLTPLEQTLQIIHRNSIDDLFLFIYDCGIISNPQCHEEKEKMIELSTFLIILPGNNIVNEYVSNLIYLALSRGSIPVIVGKEHIRLPFDEVIDWRRAALMLQTARLPEVHFILRSIGAIDIYQLKYHGRRIFENYLATAKQILDTTISVMSMERFNYPPPPVQDVKTILHNQDKKMISDINCTSTACIEAKSDNLNSLLLTEMLGPRERPFASQTYRRNFSIILSSSYDVWNNILYSPLQLFPSLPIDPSPPSEYKFFSPDRSYRPIDNGLGGSGNEFSRSLGGDHPNEQFTIVLLTYERNSILMKTLERLKGLAYLNKIIVVWNGVSHKPSENMIWPDVGVPILVAKVERNSLNNRFLPYDAIETDAILSLDDDSPLRQDEIVFGFRVWRQSRDRIVGFPGRYHAWDNSQNSWMYNSNHSCELSMVLTGGAFFHKYYSYIYTYKMPETIRSLVDKFMNCEDIAMNFLVAHLTRKPPIKVTSRWTFHCPGCPSSLSEDDSHFRERHECLNTFAAIYGYMPLLNTQHRSDSVLFKTRLPPDKQKCFRYV